MPIQAICQHTEHAVGQHGYMGRSFPPRGPEAGVWERCWLPRPGDFVQRVNRGSNVHIANRVEADEIGTKVTMACGGVWYSGVLNHVDSYAHDPRACHRCWASM
jgi:hypothetical protein